MLNQLRSQSRAAAIWQWVMADRIRLPVLIGAAVTAILVMALIWSAITGNPQGGEPRVIVAFEASLPMPSESLLEPPSPQSGDTTPDVISVDPSAHPVNSNIALTEAAEGLLAPSKSGLLPVIAPDGRRSVDVYARPFDAGTSAGRPRIAILIGGMGLSHAATQMAIDVLPPEVTFAFSPHARDLSRWVSTARAAGHEVMLQVPMEPFDYPENDPGPYTLLTDQPIVDNIQKLEWLLARFTGYVGVVNQAGAKFTASRKALEPILDAMTSRGLGFVDTGESPRSMVVDIANDIGLISATGDTVFDRSLTADTLDQPSMAETLKSLETIANGRGSALGIGTAYPRTIEEVSRWIGEFEERGLVLAPVSTVLERPGKQAG